MTQRHTGVDLKDTGSTFTHLEGALSGESYPADELIGLDPVDERPLLARYDIEKAARTLTEESLAERQTGGLWRWAELLPVRDRTNVVYLGEGDTPILQQPRLGEAIGVQHLSTKAEGLNPTGSFKARGMAVAVSRAVELGVTSFVAPSAGNAAGALAAYGAAAGAKVTVLTPVDATLVNKEEVLVMGARLILVRGLISDCGKISTALADRIGAFDVSTLKEPYRVEGKKTMGFELAEQSGWKLPDVIFYPTGGGTGLIGMWKAFAELEAVGLIGPERPRMYAVQAAGCAPVVRAFERGEEFAERWEGAATVATGIRVPSAVGDFLILRAVRESGGAAIAVEEGDILEAVQDAANDDGMLLCPEGGAVLAGWRSALAQGLVTREETALLFNCA